jgi:DNA polymerase-3 subunit chi
MTEVLFYHLTETMLDDALPPLLEKSMERGWRVVVQTDGEDRLDALNAHLWGYSDESFLAHGTDVEPDPDRQPILLTSTAANGNAATVRFLVDGADCPDIASYQRVVVMFDGHDDQQLQAARALWKSLKSDGHSATYWQQTPERRWEKKA